MGLCFTREKDEGQFIKYVNRYVYCEVCLAKMSYNSVYIVTHCGNRSRLFCSRECYGFWLVDGV